MQHSLVSISELAAFVTIGGVITKYKVSKFRILLVFGAILSYHLEFNQADKICKNHCNQLNGVCYSFFGMKR